MNTAVHHLREFIFTHYAKSTPLYLSESALVSVLFNSAYDFAFVSLHIVTTTCTVLLLMPKAFAVCRTVALWSMI